MHPLATQVAHFCAGSFKFQVSDLYDDAAQQRHLHDLAVAPGVMGVLLRIRKDWVVFCWFHIKTKQPGVPGPTVKPSNKGDPRKAQTHLCTGPYGVLGERKSSGCSILCCEWMAKYKKCWAWTKFMKVLAKQDSSLPKQQVTIILFCVCALSCVLCCFVCVCVLSLFRFLIVWFTCCCL